MLNLHCCTTGCWAGATHHSSLQSPASRWSRYTCSHPEARGACNVVSTHFHDTIRCGAVKAPAMHDMAPSLDDTCAIEPIWIHCKLCGDTPGASHSWCEGDISSSCYGKCDDVKKLHSAIRQVHQSSAAVPLSPPEYGSVPICHFSAHPGCRHRWVELGCCTTLSTQ